MRRLTGLKKETFEVIKTRGIPGKYFYRRSFATWDVLLPLEEIAKKLATKNITTKYFRLQSEYHGKRRIKVTGCNMSMQLNGEVLTAYLSSFGGVEDYTLITSVHGMTYSDSTFTMILDRGGFNAIPHTITYRDMTITVIVEGRKLLCWHCKQVGHFSRCCPRKTTKITTPLTTTITTITTIVTTATTPSTNESPKPETGDHPDKEEEGWTLVTKGGKRKPHKNSN